MKTTSLFVELIVIGTGTACWLLLLALSFTPLSLESFAFSGAGQNVAYLIVLLSLIYLLGIITDRLADRLLSRMNRKIRYRLYPDRKEILPDKIVIYEKASPLVDMINYGRSRMRICRGWLLNTILLVPSFNLFLWQTSISSFSIWLFSNITLLALLLGLFLAWKNLTYKEYEKVRDISSFLKGTAG